MEAAKDNKIVAVTAAMASGTGLNIFSKVYTKINNNIDKYNKLEFKQYVNSIIHYLNEKDIRINFSFNVILVSMIKNKKTIIKNIYNEKSSSN